MHITLTTNKHQSKLILLKSLHIRSKTHSKLIPDTPRQNSVFGTKSYQDALKRAFNQATERIYLNPDMQFFLTFTYKQQNNTPEQVLSDIKTFIRNQKRKQSSMISIPTESQTYQNTNTSPINENHTNPSENKKHLADGRPAQPTEPKYIFVLEYQKRGSIHVHMISNHFFFTNINKNGHFELTDWKKGYSSIRVIEDFDQNFKPYLYLFKYMKKAPRIGNSFVHSSRNFDTVKNIEYDDIDLQNNWRLNFKEIKEVIIPTTLRKQTFIKEYYEKIN